MCSTTDGRPIKIVSIIDEHIRECVGVGMNEFTSAGSPSVHGCFQAFRFALCDTFGPVALSGVDVAAFRGRVLSASIGALRLSNVAVSGDVTVRRTPQLIASATHDYMEVGVQLHGRSVVSQDGREAVLTPGDYAVWDTMRPYTLNRSGINEMLVVMFPREIVRVSPQRLSGLTARRVCRQQGLAASVSPFLVELGKRVHSLNHSGGLYLADAVLDMLAASFAEQLSREGPVETGGSGLRLGVQAHIEQQLADPSLTVSAVAAANHISVRCLQKLFENEGETVTGWIRARRTAHCRRDLADPQFAQLPIRSIAARWGLTNAAHFSRLFKSVYGLSPSEYRAQALSTRARGPHPIQLHGVEPPSHKVGQYRRPDRPPWWPARIAAG
jgi:AraC-like DNA-binding protein